MRRAFRVCIYLAARLYLPSTFYSFTLVQLGISPGGNLMFERAPFKLTAEMVQILGGSGGMDSAGFRAFEDLTSLAFLAARRHMQDIVALVAGMADSALPSFLFPDTLTSLQARFLPDATDAEAAAHMIRLVREAATSWRTVLYDGVQRVQQGVHSEAWL